MPDRVFCVSQCHSAEGHCANGQLISQPLRTRPNHCGTCNPGFFLDGTNCDGCPAGFFNDDSAADACKLCSDCETSFAHAAFCWDCPAGRFLDEGDIAAGASQGALTCRHCPLGLFSSIVQSQRALEDQTCTTCPAGQVAAPDGDYCWRCERGTYRRGTSCIGLQPEVRRRASTLSVSVCPRSNHSRKPFTKKQRPPPKPPVACLSTYPHALPDIPCLDIASTFSVILL